MENKKYIYIMVLLVAALITAFASSYAFFSINAEDTVVGNYEVVFNERLRFNVSGTQSDNVVVSDFEMFGSGEEKIVVNNAHNVTISIENLVDSEAISCTYDYVWRWDTTKDGYKKSAGAIYEYVVTGPFGEVNVPDYDASSFVLGSDTIALSEGQTQNEKEVEITTKFYNLADIDQNIHASKSYNGGVIIDNISCN